MIYMFRGLDPKMQQQQATVIISADRYPLDELVRHLESIGRLDLRPHLHQFGRTLRSTSSFRGIVSSSVYHFDEIPRTQ